MHVSQEEETLQKASRVWFASQLDVTHSPGAGSGASETQKAGWSIHTILGYRDTLKKPIAVVVFNLKCQPKSFSFLNETIWNLGYLTVSL